MKSLFTLFFLLGSLLMATAQPNTNKPVRCKFDLQKKGDHQYELVAKLQIEPGWHLFTADPGGDGFLIPTTVKLEASEEIKHPEKLIAASKVITKEIKEIGVVNYVEGDALFIMPITTTAGQTTIKGMFSYQCCNDHMCLPPADEVFTFEIKD